MEEARRLTARHGGGGLPALAVDRVEPAAIAEEALETSVGQDELDWTACGLTGDRLGRRLRRAVSACHVDAVFAGYASASEGSWDAERSRETDWRAGFRALSWPIPAGLLSMPFS